MIRNYNVIVLGFMALFCENCFRSMCEAQTSGVMTRLELYGGMEIELPKEDLLCKAVSDSREFNAKEIRLLLNYLASVSCGDIEVFYIERKFIDMGSDIFPIICTEAFQALENDEPMGEAVARVAVGFFADYEAKADDKPFMRKTTLKLLEKNPEFSNPIAPRVMGKIGKPEDVPELLSYIKNASSFYLIIGVIEAIAKIAAVSQIPEIEKAVAEWEKKYPTNNEEWRKSYKVELEKCLANIKERNVQWTPPPKEEPPPTKRSLRRRTICW